MICKNLQIVWSEPIFDRSPPMSFIIAKLPQNYEKAFDCETVTGYKQCITEDGERCIVEFSIPLYYFDEVLTNMLRKCCHNKEFAVHRCKVAKVVKIYNVVNPDIKYDHAIPIWGNKDFVYHVGCIAIECDFDTNLEVVCTRGIHFVLSKKLATIYPYTGKYDANGKID